MSGHNKWSKIKNKKAVTDEVKSKIFSKMAKFISTTSKQVGGDITSPILRAMIDKAREYNMPRDIIERAIKKGAGSNTLALEAITYEAHGPGGSALIIEALTDNRNKAAQEVKFILSKHNLSLATPGSAMWAFKKESATNDLKPTITIQLSEDEEKKLGALIEELEDNNEVRDVYTNAV